jgi:hypothetical protein
LGGDQWIVEMPCSIPEREDLELGDNAVGEIGEEPVED